MGSAISSGQFFRFGLFEVDAAHRTLTRKGVRVKIQDQPLRVLLLLLEQPGTIVTREQLRQALWPEGTHVDFDGSLNVVLKKLRAAIDDDSDNPRFVETVPRQGYRFIAPVSIDQSGSALKMLKLEARPSPATSAGSPARKVRPWLTFSLAALALVLASSGWWYFLRYRSVVHAAPKAIAVLPFSNEGAGADFEYLRYAIANDLVTDLTHAGSVDVRPLASTSKYAGEPADPASAGKELHVTNVLAGGFLIDQRTLRVHLELVDVGHNQVVWRDQVTVAPQELIALHDKLAVSATQRLLPAMHLAALGREGIPSPRNQEAFYLFLHALTVPLDPEPNRTAITKLQESVSLDSGYAPAWGELGWRYYLDYRYGDGGEAARADCLQAFKRQSELDPNAPAWTTVRVEQGDLNGAYDQVAEMLRRRPDFSGSHFGMSYILRYVGLLEEAGKECDAALSLDPVNGYRSCAVTFILSGDYDHAQRFIDLDKGSGYAALLQMHIALRMQNAGAALAEANAAAQLGYRFVDANLVRVCLGHPSQGELAKAAAEVEADPVSSHDPELLYQNAEVLAFCKQDDAAIRELGKAISSNYCSYPAMEKDPQFEIIRQHPEFVALKQAGINCQQSFLAHRRELQAAAAEPH